MQVLACAPAQVRDSFSNYEGESPRGLDTELYGEANEKDSWGRRSLWPTRRFRVNSREVVPAQPVVATPSNALIRQCFRGRTT
jgi:hypothetical protein